MNDQHYLETLPAGLRSPQWRWQVALSAIVHGQRNVGTAFRDRHVRQFVQYLDAPRRDMASSEEIRRRFPIVYMASEINAQNGFGKPKWLLEALVLGRCTTPRIAQLLALGPDGEKIVHVYKKLFFDVREIMDNPVAIYQNVLSDCMIKTDGADNCDYVWKAIAYAWGWKEFLEVIAGCLMPGTMKNKNLIKRLVEWQKNRLVYSSICASNNFQRRNMQVNFMLIDKARENLSINTLDLDKSTGDRPEMAAKMVLSALQTALMERPPPAPPGLDLATEPRLELNYLTN